MGARSMWNRSFAKIYPMFALKDINRMEAEFLGQLDYCMTIQAEEYTKYYFALQDERTDHKASSSSREQLDRDTAVKLEVRPSPTALVMVVGGGRC